VAEINGAIFAPEAKAIGNNPVVVAKGGRVCELLDKGKCIPD